MLEGEIERSETLALLVDYFGWAGRRPFLALKHRAHLNLRDC